jgi:hypothetical protein
MIIGYVIARIAHIEVDLVWINHNNTKNYLWKNSVEDMLFNVWAELFRLLPFGSAR